MIWKKVKNAKTRERDAQGDCKQAQVQRAAEAEMVLPNVPKAVPGPERLQVPHDERSAPAPDAAVRRGPGLLSAPVQPRVRDKLFACLYF